MTSTPSTIATTRIILAEDHVLMRDGLKMLLGTQPGLEVVAETGDGMAVEALVRQFNPQLLLLDLGLPGQHGVKIAASIKAECSDTVKVLVLTGDLQADSVRQALAAGADGYVHKSEDSAELLQAVHAVLAGRQYVSSNIAAAFSPRARLVDSAGDSLVATPREREIMSLVARGLSNREIAELLAISVLTVRTHRQNLMEKFSLRNAAEITAYAVQRGYYSPV
ncbi:response regulator transcription factor [Polaromonas sp. JS666]|uniref:response regulator n=1 Tax=Polaromonas sp. (strain JS666 / ATCC BAA-500) TaxID=296591 RepID=UPI00087ED840|nr:response regulator transcription factor [Polaromonas sp. JS666]SDM68937.1 DNA-binding response regulator, NarL/FixJ family, contains REC and HTH domains [Polaromonas sp. JS666]